MSPSASAHSPAPLSVPPKTSTSGHERRRKERSFWGLVSLTAGLLVVGAWAFTTARRQKRINDEKTLAGLRHRPLVFTEHAQCRLDCRRVTKAEVVQALRSGSVNNQKSAPKARPCPKWVVDAAVRDEVNGRPKNVQTVVLGCPTESRVLTVIDRGEAPAMAGRGHHGPSALRWFLCRHNCPFLLAQIRNGHVAPAELMVASRRAASAY